MSRPPNHSVDRAVHCWLGIDLGSTTTKAVILDDRARLLGRGISNSRGSYEVACQVALAEALADARFSIAAAELERAGISELRRTAVFAEVERRFRERQYRAQLQVLRDVVCRSLADEDESVGAEKNRGSAVRPSVDAIFGRMEQEAGENFREGVRRKSDFFRDLAGNRYAQLAEQAARDGGPSFDRLLGLYDHAILEVENTPSAAGSFEEHAVAACRCMERPVAELLEAVEKAIEIEIRQVGSVGTGYGRQRLPFPREQIRSEILCHGLGAHTLFPGTRTVLDIGGQDTKAIQVDENGVVASFQMNDRCAAGCGRYLGYIADEMNLGLQELGPLAAKSSRPVRINSTCTVFAGAELRERLSVGQKREDIVAGLHRAIILRAMSLLARSGGVRTEFTFTGGVAKNPAAVDALRDLVNQNYGAVKINISPDSIYTGALGAALFALRASPSVGGDSWAFPESAKPAEATGRPPSDADAARRA